MIIRHRRKMIPILFALCGACIGTFVAVRMRGFFVLTWNAYLPMWSLLAVTSLFAVLPLIFSNRLTAYYKRYISVKSPSFYIIALISLVFCIALREFIFDSALAGSGVYPSTYTRLLNMIGAVLLSMLFLTHIWSVIRRSFPSVLGWMKSLDKREFLFIIAVIVMLNLLAWFYISRSSKIYFWDSAGYWQIAQLLAETAKQGIAQLLLLVYHSILTSDYNYLIALPLTPLVLIFGASRWVYICGIVNLGLVPLLILIYGYIRGKCRRKILASLCLIGSLPMLIYSTLVGYIDIIGVIFILAALLLWKYDENKNDFGHFVIIGALLAISILLRRWFTFFALSFVIALVIDSIFYRKSVIPIIGTLTSLGFSLLFLFQPFVSNILLKNYGQLYSAYKMGLAFDAEMFINYFGVLTLAVVLITGIYFSFKRDTRQPAVFALFQMLICFIVFTSVQSHNQQHLLLYIPSLVLLMSMLICPLSDAVTKRKAAGVLLALTTLLPSLSTVFPAIHPKQIEKAVTVSLLPHFTFKPPVWSDAKEIVRIIRYLDEAFGSRGKTVGVVASSFALNYDILMNAEASLNLNRVSDVSRSYLYALPAVDSRDAFPGPLFECDYLLVADPIQLHLGEEKQQVVYLPAEKLLNHTGFGVAYEKTGETFFLNGGQMKIMLYEKMRALTENEKTALINEFDANK